MKMSACSLVAIITFYNIIEAGHFKVQYLNSTKTTVTMQLTDIKPENFQNMLPAALNEFIYGFFNVFPMLQRFHVDITSNAEFLEMQKVQMEEKRSISFEEVDLNKNFLTHYNEIVPSELSRITFLNCRTFDGVSYADFLVNRKIEKVSIVNCGLTLPEVNRLLAFPIKEMDLSSNRLWGESENLRETLENAIKSNETLEKLNLSDNDLCPTVIPRDQTHCSITI